MNGDSDPNTREVQDRIVRVNDLGQYGLYTVLSSRDKQNITRKDDGNSLKIQGLC